METISIAKNFSIYPGGRVKEDGPYSGQLFKEQFLIPILKDLKQVIIDLDGTRGYGSSFLEEAFGGLIRDGYPKSQILTSFKFKSSDQSIIDEINEYIDAAAKRSTK